MMARKIYYNPYAAYFKLASASTAAVSEKEEKAQEPRQQWTTFVRPFLHHLERKRGEMITVATTRETVNGRLENVFSDHIQLTVDGQNYHIRVEQIIYFY